MQRDGETGDNHVRWESRDTEPTRSVTRADRRVDDAIEVREAERPGAQFEGYHPGPDTYLLGLRRDLERIGLEAVEWADAASDALRHEAEQEAAQIQADAVRRTDRLMREVEEARSALRQEARLAATRIWESARDPDAALVEAIRNDKSPLALPPISWHAGGPHNGATMKPAEASTPVAEVPVVVDDEVASVDPVERVVPPVPHLEAIVREPPPPRVPGPPDQRPSSGAGNDEVPSGSADSPQILVATDELETRTAPRRSRGRVAALAAALVVVLLFGAWLITRSDDSGPSSQPAVIESSPTTTVPGAGRDQRNDRGQPLRVRPRRAGTGRPVGHESRADRSRQ